MKLTIMVSGVNVQLTVAGATILDKDRIGGWYNQLTSPFTLCVCACVRACVHIWCVCVLSVGDLSTQRQRVQHWTAGTMTVTVHNQSR